MGCNYPARVHVDGRGQCLHIIALFRLILPDVDLKIAGGREANLRSMQAWMFYAGGTSCIVGNYLTTRGRSSAEDLRMIEDLGLEIVDGLHAAPAARAPVGEADTASAEEV